MFDAFSSRQPVSTSLENALVLMDQIRREHFARVAVALRPPFRPGQILLENDRQGMNAHRGTAARGSTRSKTLVCAVIDLEFATETNGKGRQHVMGVTIACAWQHSQAFHPDGHWRQDEADSTGSWTVQDATHASEPGPRLLQEASSCSHHMEWRLSKVV